MIHLKVWFKSGPNTTTHFDVIEFDGDYGHFLDEVLNDRLIETSQLSTRKITLNEYKIVGRTSTAFRGSCVARVLQITEGLVEEVAA